MNYSDNRELLDHPARIQVGKVDLDTCGTGFLIGVAREDQVEVLRNAQATEENLSNPKIFCIEVGGSGRVGEDNFDHHGEGAKNLRSATYQVAYPEVSLEVGPGFWWGEEVAPEFDRLAFRAIGRERDDCPACRRLKEMKKQRANSNQMFMVEITLKHNHPSHRLPIDRVISYIDTLDRKGPAALGQKVFPSLSDVFAGMLLVTRDPVEQFHLGIEILREVCERGIDAYGQMPLNNPEWAKYAEAKSENDQKVAEAVKKARWTLTRKCREVAYIETDFIGAPGALQNAGAQLVVVFSPSFGPDKVPKFTVAGNNTRVDGLISELNPIEAGWGGPSTGTIIGSPREGSKLTLQEVVDIVRKNL